jgi:peptide/nickel transport system permease protein
MLLGYIAQRLLRLIPLLFLVSVLAFVIIQIPPGDYLTEYIARLRASGYQLEEDEITRLTESGNRISERLSVLEARALGMMKR